MVTGITSHFSVDVKTGCTSLREGFLNIKQISSRSVDSYHRDAAKEGCVVHKPYGSGLSLEAQMVIAMVETVKHKVVCNPMGVT